MRSSEITVQEDRVIGFLCDSSNRSIKLPEYSLGGNPISFNSSAFGQIYESASIVSFPFLFIWKR